MTRLFLLTTVLILCVTATYSQTPIEVTTKDGRIVVLKPDGTWKFKNALPQPTLAPNETSNTSKNTDSLGANFSGHDTKALSSKLIDLRERSIKSEFETTAQYESRIKEEIRKPIIDNLTVNDVFSLVVSEVQSDYNADTQKMRFFVPVEESPRAKLARLTHRVEDKKTARDLSDFNLYSIQLKRGLYHDEESICFDELNGLQLSGESYKQGLSAEVSLNVEDAKRLKNSTKAVLIVRFLEPFVAAGNILTGKQFQVRLINVLFFDPETGRVLARLKNQ